jgi:hypothetical protein
VLAFVEQLTPDGWALLDADGIDWLSLEAELLVGTLQLAAHRLYGSSTSE